MYKKSERVLPFYSLIEKDPQAQICPCLKESDPVFLCELISAALIFASAL